MQRQDKLSIIQQLGHPQKRPKTETRNEKIKNKFETRQKVRKTKQMTAAAKARRGHDLKKLLSYTASKEKAHHVCKTQCMQNK